MKLDSDALARYLSARFGSTVEGIALRPLGGAGGEPASGGKEYGYGTPILVSWRDGAGGEHRAVIETVSPGPFGHDHRSDRAAMLLWAWDAWRRLEGHVRPLDVGALRGDGPELVSLADCGEFFLLTEFVEGQEYARDLERIARERRASALDVARVDALARYLAKIHAERGPAQRATSLYRRHWRDLVGHGECILGVLDAWPDPVEGALARRLADIEAQAVRWRWRHRDRVERLRRIHGDFHPWNVLFTEGARFVALDRSRWEYGEVADDVVCMSANYLFFSLQATGEVTPPLSELFTRFWRTWLRETGDEEVVAFAGPFLAFRALVMAHPLWYPSLPPALRARLVDLAHHAVATDHIDIDALARGEW